MFSLRPGGSVCGRGLCGAQPGFWESLSTKEGRHKRWGILCLSKLVSLHELFLTMNFTNYHILANQKGRDGCCQDWPDTSACNTARQVANSLLQEISWDKQLSLCIATWWSHQVRMNHSSDRIKNCRLQDQCYSAVTKGGRESVSSIPGLH